MDTHQNIPLDILPATLMPLGRISGHLEPFRPAIRVSSLQELKDLFMPPDLLTDGEREACNLATD
jgi:hypothetical protein